MTVRLSSLIAAAALLVAGCGGSEEAPAPVAATTPAATATPTPTAVATPTPTPAGKDCAEVGDLDAVAKRLPPDDVRLLDYAHFYKAEGKRRFYAVLDGGLDEIPWRRDDAATYLIQSSSYEQLAIDDEPGVSTASLRGEHHEVDLRVTALCEGKIGIRYTVRAL